MKTIILFLTGGLALVLTGCTDQQARQYSEKINAILQNYQSQIKRNIDSEQRAYEKLAAVYETEKQRDVFESLDTERTLRSGALSAMLVEGPAKASAITEELEKYAGEDFDRTQKIYAEEMDAESVLPEGARFPASRDQESRPISRRSSPAWANRRTSCNTGKTSLPSDRHFKPKTRNKPACRSRARPTWRRQMRPTQKLSRTRCRPRRIR